jgi:hypothetical protein
MKAVEDASACGVARAAIKPTHVNNSNGANSVPLLKFRTSFIMGWVTKKVKARYRGFMPDDELLQLVCRAEMAMHQLHVKCTTWRVAIQQAEGER